MMNLKKYAEYHRMKIITIIVLINKKRDQGKYCIFNESKNTYIKMVTGNETFLKTYDSFSSEYSYICNYKKFSLIHSYKSMNKTIPTHIGVDHIHIFFQQ